MATPRRPYASIRLGYFQDALVAGVSHGATLLLALLFTHRDKRSIPGLLRFGPAAIAETLKLSPRLTRRQLGELETHGLILFDRREPLLYCVGAIEMDPPKTENSVRGMAAQFRELPTDSSVTVEIRRAITGAVSADGKWLAIWNECAQGPGAGPGANPGAGPGAGPLRDPIANGQDPMAAAAADESRYRRAWGRLPPPFAAAAAEDFSEAGTTYTPEDFDTLIAALAASRWVTGGTGLTTPPTLKKLLADPSYARRIVLGEFGVRNATWRCPDCDAEHTPSAECPPKCRACKRGHAVGYVCRKLKDLENQEQAMAEEKRRATWRSIDGESFEQLRARVGWHQAMDIYHAERLHERDERTA